MISTLIALPYEIARLPLVLVDETLAGRLSDASPPRVTLERTIGSADKLAGALLGNREIAARGAERLERSRKLRSAARREQQATSLRRQARDTSAAARDEAAAKREAAEERVTSGLREADKVEEKGKRDARENATRTAASKKKTADRSAANRTATTAERQRRVESAAEAKKRTAQQAATGELDEARDTKRSAARDRAEAERLSDLTEVKKKQRKRT